MQSDEIQTKVLEKDYTFIRPKGSRVVVVKAPYDDLHDAIRSIPEMLITARVEYEVQTGEPLDIEDMFVTVAYTTFDILLEIGPIE